MLIFLGHESFKVKINLLLHLTKLYFLKYLYTHKKLQNEYKESCVSFTQIPPTVTSYIAVCNTKTRKLTLVLFNYWLDYRPYSVFTIF